jgi:hypothetical protein
MPLLTGQWRAFVNGLEGDLTIDSVDGNGRVSGELIVPGVVNPSAQGLVGLWDEASGALTFFWLGGEVVFTAHHFQSSSRAEEGRDITHTLAGHCVVRAPGPLGTLSPTARRQQFGWFAQLTQVV